MKRLFLTSLAAMFILSGCTRLNPEDVPIIEEILPSETETVELNLEYLDEVVAIEIVDSYEGKYEEELYIKLTAEEIAALKGMKDRMVSEPLPWESNGVGYSGYKMNMYDKDGNLLTSWNCGSYYRIIDSQGQFIDINDELREWKKGMEKAHDVSFSIYARTPGENYFAELVNADHGNGIEVYLANGSDDYIRFDLDDEDLYTLQELTDTICVIRKSPLTIKEMDQEYDNLKYTLSVYTNTEASYDFVITDDGSIYIQTKYTFLVGGEGVEEWFRTLEAKYGLDKI